MNFPDKDDEKESVPDKLYSIPKAWLLHILTNVLNNADCSSEHPGIKENLTLLCSGFLFSSTVINFFLSHRVKINKLHSAIWENFMIFVPLFIYQNDLLVKINLSFVY